MSSGADFRGAGGAARPANDGPAAPPAPASTPPPAWRRWATMGIIALGAAGLGFGAAHRLYASDDAGRVPAAPFIADALNDGTDDAHGASGGPQAAPHATAFPTGLRLPGPDGTPLALDAYRGKWRLVNFWATWCAPCMNEIPVLLATAHARGGAVQVLGLAMDDPKQVGPKVRELKIDYPVATGDEDLLALMQRLGNDNGVLPFSVLLDPDGRIVDRHFGEFTGPQLQALLDEQLPAR